jgi:hypothetical protein
MVRRSIPEPVFRNLRVFAVDPGMTARFETAVMNEMKVSIPWEQLGPGPLGKYIAVVDRDENDEEVNSPVNLDSPDLLAQNGLPPSDGSPQFRQQMLYAVAMKTVRNFEDALGRSAHWPGGQAQLRLYPQYMQAPNAYYESEKGLCFGYFRSNDAALPGTVVYTSLSQDVIAHELTHALLRGMFLEFDTSSESDDGALHEAFADLVALFQHFADSEVFREQIAAVRGDLRERSLLGAIAPQFGRAIGQPDGLRNALGFTDEQGAWHARVPDPRLYQTLTEPHQRGDILVAAVFAAFTKIYDSRVADLRRIATKGTGVLPAGYLHPDLINRLAHEASQSARHVLHMCIRALDYLPPVGVTFGDFLRGIITADYDLVPVDDRRYRVAFIDAFRSYGLMPSDVGTLSVDTLLWSAPVDDENTAAVTSFFQELSRRTTYWGLPRDREELWKKLEGWKRELAKHLKQSAGSSRRLGPIDLRKKFEVRSLSLRRDTKAAGDLLLQWVVKIVQKGAGCALLVEADSGLVRFLIETRVQADKKDPANGDADLPVGNDSTPTPPTERSLRVFTFDPSLGAELDTAGINEVTLRVPWERRADGQDALQPGPVGEYLEVVDRDPGSGCFYAEVDLDDTRIVAQDGLPPSESNPQFQQQMVYAVAMRIIRDFERALGRLALWSPRRYVLRGQLNEAYVPRLRIYPHALREANAYYSPVKKALLFGYFPATGEEPDARAGNVTVFTCLSHDIVAHEVTHALLDGIHRRFSEASNPDVLAFHEAFADIVALFEHFSLPEVLRHQIAATRGDLASQNRLGELAQQFGEAIGKRGALRSAIGRVNASTGRWEPIDPDPGAYRRQMEPHDRGAILVAAVFDAFLTIYKARVADLLRIATEGTGVLPEGHLHPDLVNRLADEAATAAQRVLDMCIRALDYCPPVDVTFGDYLRAVITADFEYDPVDGEHRRVAFVEAFRRYGIVPEDVRTLSVDGLLWRPTSAAPDEDEDVVIGLVGKWAKDMAAWNLSRDRKRLFEMLKSRRAGLHEYLKTDMKPGSAVLSAIDPKLPFEVHSIRPSLGTDWNGRPQLQWVIELTQRIQQKEGWILRGGCTLLVDAATGKVRYSIKKKLDETRTERQRSYFLAEGNESLAATYFGGANSTHDEPFAMLHRF